MKNILFILTFITFSGNIVVAQTAKPIAGFTVYNHPYQNYFNACAYTNIHFGDTSLNGVTTRQWYFYGGKTKSSQNISADVFYDSSGWYSVKLVVCNSAGCDSVTKTNHVYIYPLPLKMKLIQPTTNIICPVDSILLRCDTLNTFSTKEWYHSYWLVNSNLVGTQNYFYAKDSGFYFLKYTNTAGCSNFSDTIQIKYSTTKIPSVTTKILNKNLCPGEKDTLFSNYSTGNIWYKNNTLLTNDTNNFLLVRDSGSYRFENNTKYCRVKSTPLKITVSVVFKFPDVSSKIYHNTLCPGKSDSVFSQNKFGNRWYKNTIFLPNDTNYFLMVSDSGLYHYENYSIPCPAISNNLKINLAPNYQTQNLKILGDSICKPGIDYIYILSDSIPDPYANYYWYLQSPPISSFYPSNVQALIRWGQSGNGVVTILKTDIWVCSKITADYKVRILNYDGIDQLNYALSLKVFPNPSSQKATITLLETQKEFSVTILNLLGKTVFETVVENSSTCELNTSQLIEGIYMLLIKTADGGSSSTKIAIQH